jgi:hypothetical protein
MSFYKNIEKIKRKMWVNERGKKLDCDMKMRLNSSIRSKKNSLLKSVFTLIIFYNNDSTYWPKRSLKKWPTLKFDDSESPTW